MNKLSSWVLMSFGSISLVVTVVVVDMLAVGQEEVNCIICHVAFLSIKFLLCCNSASSNWSHPSAFAAADL